MNTPHFQMSKVIILVADASRARLLAVESPTGPLMELESLVNPAARLRQQDLSSDRQGRSFQSAGTGRSAMAETTTPKEQETAVFARELTQNLQERRKQGELEKLYVVAPPAFLGELRKHLGAEVASVVVAEIDKDYTRLDARELREKLPQYLK
ncbi:host attachment protein [Desulfurispirillum indicum]|uniref:Host attachment protein n=1 Tax=Desulfurispirillum indicum (strain ATCC BAA-1389 / DSM 22839 / S5) TaxID=653733 RepID=E6W3J1_DESIS|nr:host attachment protein [Desulfurispirillum indicum]ADU65784.1 Host attachment protein [Desulfurispirillum indicum S5]UCZ57721.1 host attachment protein [Desulfurispirillum indicum]